MNGLIAGILNGHPFYGFTNKKYKNSDHIVQIADKQ